MTTTDSAAAVAAPGDPPLDGYLGMLAVDARFGSRGIGRVLMAAGEEAARHTFGAVAVVLWVLSCRDDILAWYTRRGYALTGLRTEARSLIEGICEESELLADADFVILRRVLPPP